MSIVLVCLLLLCLGRFSWAVLRHFAPGDGMRLGALTISGLSLLFSLGLGVGIVGTAGPELVPLSLYLASLGLFEWAVLQSRRGFGFAFTEQGPSHLVTSGPYRFIRHPFYTAYILFWFAGAIAVAQPWAFLAPLVMTALYWAAARREERSFACSRLQADYRRYRRDTGMFFPFVAL